ncbi:MAG: hypothetical protein WD708_13020 [Kiritimatiellia bacterium]
MNQAAISADIISFTALAEGDRERLWNLMETELKELEKAYNKVVIVSRLVSGDHIEMALRQPQKSLRIALILKSRVKMFETKAQPVEESRAKYFDERGLRIAIGVGPDLSVSKETGLIDGEPIYMTGRKLQKQSTAGKEKIFIKNTLYFCSQHQDWNEKYELLFSFIDTLISHCSKKQSEVLYYRLLGKQEAEIAKILQKSQSTVSHHAKLSGWHVIEKALNMYEKEIQ